MSKFLAPIHFIMYDKILFLDKLTNKYIDFAEKNNIELESLNSLESIDYAPLDEIIDESNIHTWIQKRVSIVEDKLAYIVSEILKENETFENEILEIAKNTGEEESFSGNSREAFVEISNRFLDGMPCDHAISILEEDENFLKYKIEIDKHSEFWNYGINSNIYWKIRNSFIEGLIGKDLKLEKLDNIYEIRG